MPHTFDNIYQEPGMVAYDYNQHSGQGQGNQDFRATLGCIVRPPYKKTLRYFFIYICIYTHICICPFPPGGFLLISVSHIIFKSSPHKNQPNKKNLFTYYYK